MRKINFSSLTFLFLLIASFVDIPFLFAQDKSIKFGKVAQSDITMSEYELEPDAEAVILAKKWFMSMDLEGDASMKYTRFERIKIFKESAFDFAKVDLQYYYKDRREAINGMQAMITYPDGTSYKLKKNEFYKEKINEFWTKISFTFPKVVEGAIVEYSYQLRSNTVFTPDEFYFQGDIPVRYAELSYKIPDHIDFIFLKQGNSMINDGRNVFTIANVPSMKEEPYITTMTDYRGKIKMQVKGYEDSYNAYHPLLSTWDKLAEELLKDSNFGEQLSKKMLSNKMVKSARPYLDADLAIKDKILSLQNFLLENVNWQGNRGIYSGDGIADAFKNKEGHSSELNLMMIVLLRELGIVAHPILVSARDNGKLIKIYPFVDQFSYALVYAEVDDKIMLIDVSNEYRPPGTIRSNALNEDGFIVEKDNSRWHKIIAPKSRNVSMGLYSISGDTITGTLRGKYDSYRAVSEREYYTDQEEEGEHWQGKLREKFPDAEVSSSSFENLENLYTSFKDELSINIPGAVVDAGDMMYIDPFLHGSYSEKPF